MPVYAAAIALSAFLLFLVQPLIARQILPWFGGSAAVWTTCMVFFQSALLLGYGYSDAIARRLTPRAQAMVHTAALVASLAFLPIVAAGRFRPEDASHPIGRILLLLAATVGLPYLLLSTTGPLIQAWFARAFPGAGVYRLYALSNVASLLALASYPLLIEPNASLRAQALGWSMAYVLFAGLAIASAWVTARHAAGPRTAAVPAEVTEPGPDSKTGNEIGAARDAGTDREAASTPAAPTASEQAAWFVLALLGSVLLLSVTAHLTQDVAPVPFLWVLPLAIYLLSFILCFDRSSWYRPPVVAPTAAVLVVMMLAGLEFRVSADGGIEAGILPIGQAVLLYCGGLFIACMFCHGELYRRRPATLFLTRFYLMLAFGGACGGLLVGLLAPLVLPAHLEMPVALFLLAILVWRASRGIVRPLALLAVPLCAGLLSWHLLELTQRSIELSRSFYGSLRVERTTAAGDPDETWALLHGATVHGTQFRDPARRGLPTAYYGEESGVGRVIVARRPAALRIGVIGLGVGTLAAYGRQGDMLRFYELAPDVADIAQRRFTFLSDTAATVELVLGDGRLALERQAPQHYDLLVVDAFSSDAIPMHLLTTEAMAAYLRHLAPDGVLALHVTNRYLELAPLVGASAGAMQIHAWRIDHEPPDAAKHLYSSTWVLVARSAAALEPLRLARIGAAIEPVTGLRPWTDDYSNLLQVLR